MGTRFQRVTTSIGRRAVAALVAAMSVAGASARASPPAEPPAAPPFEAWVADDYGFVRARPTHASRLVALLRTGDTVRVVGCQPTCAARGAWALIEPQGAILVRQLRAGAPTDAARRLGSAATYFWGRVPRGRTPVHAAPDPRSKVVRRDRAEYRVAFVPDPHLSETGWLRRPDGGYMRMADVKLFSPSRFTGERDPRAPIAFVRRKVALRPGEDAKAPKDPAAVTWFERYDRLPVAGVSGGRVRVAGGWLPRNRVRIAAPVERPRGVAPTDRWLHIDLGDQVLAAYQGDTMVYATMVSTGKSGRRSTRTHVGRFAIYGKTVHGSMRGKPWDDYYAEEVPWVMHFDGGRALHGAYWHDQFGVEKSHGCVNLSPADAAWLFAWVPPQVPAGWHNVLPGGWGGPQVPVVVDRPGQRQTRPRKLARAHAAEGAAVAGADRVEAER